MSAAWVDLQTCHEILGHCNSKNVPRLQNLKNGIKIESKAERPNQEVEVCGFRENISKLEIKFGSKDFFMDGTIDLGGLIQAYKHVQSYVVLFLKVKSHTLSKQSIFKQVFPTLKK